MLTCKSCSRSVVRALLSVSTHELVPTLSHTVLDGFASNIRRSAFSTTSRSFLLEQGSERRIRPRIGVPQNRDPEGKTGAKTKLPLDIQTYEEAGEAALRGNRAIEKYKSKPLLQEKGEHVSLLDGMTPINRAQISKHAHLEMRYLEEPYKVAQRCKKALENGEFDLAVTLARLAGLKDIDTTVSWNHIINTACKAGFLQTARKLYHDMKKRNQKPDAYTFTILLNGHSTHKSPSESQFRGAYGIYEALYQPNSPVQPNIIHSNAMLQICAKSGQLGALFDVAARLPERGPNSPDQITYTIIFNAMSNAQTPEGIDGDPVRLERISQARRIWSDVLEKRDSGLLLLGERLVCAMGRVLLSSPSEQDRRSVLTLLEEVMDIPQQYAESSGLLPGPSNSSAKSSQQSIAGTPKDQVQSWSVKDVLASTTSGIQSTNKSESTSTSTSLKTTGIIISPKPGPKTLSLILTTCATLGDYEVATKYWDLLTSQFKPDMLNYIEYMRQTKITTNTTLAAVLLREMYKLSMDRKNTEQIDPSVWETGITACYRSANLQVALRDATRILVMLQMSWAEPSLRVLETFTKMLMRTKAGFPVEDIMRAVETLMMAFGNFKSLYAFGRTESNGPLPPSEALNVTIAEINPSRKLKGNGMHRSLESRVTQLTEARSQLSQMERRGIRDLGRQIEIALGLVIKAYGDVMTAKQVARIQSDLHRVRAWVFPRNQHLLDEAIQEDIVKKEQEKNEKKDDPKAQTIIRTVPHRCTYNRTLSDNPRNE